MTEAATETSDKRLSEAKAHYKEASDGWKDSQKMWLEDTKFLWNLDQWPEDIKSKRDKAFRPCLVVDKLGQYVKQIVNDGRQNRPAVKVRPVDDSDEEVAEAFQGIIRSICDRSNADEAFDTALDHAVSGGFGFFRVLTEYAHPGTFNQDIVVRRVRNPMAVLLDPNFQSADGSDARYGFFVDEMTKEQFKAKYPKAKFTDWVADAPKYSDGWMTDKNVRVCEYWYKVETPETVHLLGNGDTVSDDDYQAALVELGPDGVPPILESREIPTCEVKWCRMTGAEVLEEQDWLGQYIPIVIVIGNEHDIEGKVTYTSHIRPAKDAQRLYNFSRSAFAERVALSPKAPYVAAVGQIEGFENDWETANQENLSVLTYNAIDVNGTPVAAPQRQQASDIPEGFSRDMQHSEHDIQGALGQYAASLGQQSNEKSGKAIMARQREGDTATFHFQDNQSRAIRYLGRILVDLIPKVYDSRRVVRLLGEDGKSTQATIDPDQPQPVQKIGGKSIYNLGAGTYDVSVAAGPSYTTKRQEAAEAMIQLTQANPQLLQVGGDIMVRNMDWPGADELADRLKIMLPPEIKAAEEQGADLPQEVQQAIMQVKQAQQQVEQGMQQVQQAAQELQSEQAKVQADKADVDAARAKLEAAKAELDSKEKVMNARFGELSAKLDLKALQTAQMVPPVMPQGPEEPVIDPYPDIAQPIEEPQPPPGVFFTPEEGM